MARGSHPFPVLALLAPLLAVGCVPKGVVWLPDSSGFVYSSTSGKAIVIHDVAKKSKQVIVKDTGTETAWPALSPDGKQIAVAGCGPWADGAAVKVIIYDPAGKVVKRSRIECWTEEAHRESWPQSTGLAWAPDGKHIAVICARVPPVTLLYDIKGDKFVKRVGKQPIPFGGSVFRPDGQGLLLRDTNEFSPAFSFLDLAGQEHEVAFSHRPRYVRPIIGDLLGDLRAVSASWKGDVATAIHGSGVLSIDTARLKGSFDPEGRDPEPKELERECALSGGMLLRVLRSAKDPEIYRVVAFDPKTKTVRDLFKVEYWAYVVIPSPDGKHAAIRYAPPGYPRNKVDRPIEDWIAVVNSKGEVLSNAKATE